MYRWTRPYHVMLQEKLFLLKTCCHIVFGTSKPARAFSAYLFKIVIRICGGGV